MLRETRTICTDADNRTGYVQEIQMNVVKATLQQFNSIIIQKKQHFTGYRWVAGKKVMGI